jgi:6-phosphogluconolactonase (cycloisomerase 2 family)
MPRLWMKGLLLSPLVFLALTATLFAQANFVYTNNNLFDGNTVTAFSVANDGTLTQIPGSPFATGGLGSAGGFFAVSRAATSVVGNILYISNDSSNDVSAFSINSLTGNLTPVPGSPFPTAGLSNFGISLAATPDNKFLFATNSQSGNVTVFRIAANGALTPTAGSPFPLGDTPNAIKISPDGRFLAVSFTFSDTIGMFTILSDGTLTPVPGSPFPVPGAGVVGGIDINNAGTLLFSGNAISGQRGVINVFNITLNGALTPIPGSPFIMGGWNSNVVLLSADERFLFISNQNTNTLTQLFVADNGTLTLPPSALRLNPGGAYPQQMVMNQAATLLYVNNGNGTVSVFSTPSNAYITAVPGSAFAAGSGFVPGIAAFPPFVKTPPYNICIQDDSHKDVLRINSTTGAYQFSRCGGLTLGGTGSLTTKGLTLTLQDNRADRRIFARVDRSSNRATASIQTFSPAVTFTLTDINTANNSCGCP